MEGFIIMMMIITRCCNTVEGLWLERMLQDTIDSNYCYMMQQNGDILWLLTEVGGGGDRGGCPKC